MVHAWRAKTERVSTVRGAEGLQKLARPNSRFASSKKD